MWETPGFFQAVFHHPAWSQLSCEWRSILNLSLLGQLFWAASLALWVISAKDSRTVHQRKGSFGIFSPALIHSTHEQEKGVTPLYSRIIYYCLWLWKIPRLKATMVERVYLIYSSRRVRIIPLWWRGMAATSRYCGRKRKLKITL